ncbi:MAG: DNA-binding transcriptional regulator CytR [Armatimonadota bacterium]|nr:MAG: DNA-binding transcriptional regulator CytR [Armatimonadota bacterium]
MQIKHVWVRQQVLEEIQQGRYDDRLPTKQQLAERFGVSIGTVSRALETLCQEGWLEYRRGAGIYACVSAPPRTRQVAFVVSSPADVVEHTYHGPLFRALCDVCAESDINLMVAPTPVDEWALLPERYPKIALYVVAPPVNSLSVLASLWQKGVPLVAVGASWQEEVVFPTVDSDNRGGARRGVEYLLHLGHRRIAYINGSENSTNCRDRLAGYLDALQAWSIQADERWIIRPDDDTHLSPSARNALMDLLLMPERPTAIFCAGYFLALDVIALAEQLGIAVPRQLSILGTDDPVSARYLNPPLTTLRQPLYQMGRRAADVLLRNLSRRAVPERVHAKLPVELVTRASCAPPGH